MPVPEAATIDLTARFDEALVYATHVHGGQVRKGTAIPYVSHLLAVASLVLDDGGGEDDAIGALLHDAAEDQGGLERLADVRARFGARVAAIVEGCSDTFETPKPPWRKRKEKYLAELPGQPAWVLRVSLADKLHNARCIVRDVRQRPDAWTRFNAKPADILWYYTSCLKAFEETHLPSPMVGELDRTVKEMRLLPRPAEEE